MAYFQSNEQRGYQNPPGQDRSPAAEEIRYDDEYYEDL